MLKKFLVAGAVLAGFAGMGLATPAQAYVGEPKPVNENDYNVSSVGDPVVVCGNSVIGDLTLNLSALLGLPATDADKKSVDCSIKVIQD
ncbi:hypothetical protein [Thermostaphylospora chromogena]|jgi:hypothetical protein|uniref:Secreted protein n=1 Tax=Thermostaphylospora chromogena TaxID=35622 RepID=A0A1H1E7N1_9ACTN|nr:hypothetical protein [Thermostaphylospora chromogena]SDQ84580.1 hypothetical protein SAMN04489764_2346 [Thermostaphylospora chromogena]